MNFYSSIADHYDFIFPYNEAQFTFISQNIPHSKAGALLEIGSATGSLTEACKQIAYYVEGLELDASMVRLARQKHPGLSFQQGDMLDTQQRYTARQFDTIVCFGNTLVHLQDISAIRSFLSQVFEVLSQGGRFFVQFINYDRILDFQIDRLPDIDNEHITFERQYELISDQHINFNTHLLIHHTQAHIYNTQVLYPLRKEAFENIAQTIGFKTQAYGSFAQDPWHIKSMQSIFICEK